MALAGLLLVTIGSARPAVATEGPRGDAASRASAPLDAAAIQGIDRGVGQVMRRFSVPARPGAGPGGAHRHAVRDRLDHQAVHRRCGRAAAGGRQTQPG
ncbi:hypothetical protein G6F35_018465 [Rhizopus arrhizus]|nr:hypothetical protein G6F35_018465 [Rhizopus arrhizus]